jgi:dipeptidyl aminopeptidase/acylaminoacyl peptidase
VESRDGYPVHGWITVPDGPGPHPVLLTVHGGPYSQYGWTLFDETQAYVSAGYAVVQCNPRGSSGYGQAHGRAIVGAFGTVDADDVLAFLDAALKDPRLDADRVGIMGGSYGGYMTTLLIGRTDRFAAAISERAFNDPVSFVGSSDIGWFFPDGYLGTDPERIAAQSALAGARAITTPTLVIHSEQDWRCPLEQGTRLFVELKRRGVPTELLLFPGEGHELSRSGRPRHRLARLEHVLRWWARWLPTAQNPGQEALQLAAAEPQEHPGEPEPGPLAVRSVRVP